MDKLQMQLNCLLDPREMQILNSVNLEMAQYKLQHGDTGPKTDDEKYEPLMEAMEENLKSIIENLIAEKQSMEGFVEKYSEWRQNRKKCIDRLKKIAKSLDQDRLLFNVLKLSAYLLSLTGGALCLSAGLTDDPNVSRNLAIAGGSLSAAGNIGVLGSSISETVRLKRKVKKARELLEEEKKYFARLSDGLIRATELQETLNSVLDINIMKDITASTRKLIEKTVKIKDDYKRLKTMEKGVKIIFNEVVDQDLPIAALVTTVRFYTTIFLLMCKTESRLVCDFAALSAKSVTAVALLVGHSKDMFGVAKLIAADSSTIAHVTLGVVGMVFDTVGIVKTSLDIYRNSRSPEGRKIFQSAEDLEKESGDLTAVYRVAQNFQNIKELQLPPVKLHHRKKRHLK